jgi:4-amino-4-deoxy-L-arabinose transferase-like glycosyltransferase
MSARVFQRLLVLLIGIRMIGMIFVPLADTSEPRYADIARRMAQSGDWITPWFDDGFPFWGKPPLAFWCEALSFRLLGVNEFAARLPSLIATLLCAALLFRYLRRVASLDAARMGVLVFLSSLLVYLSAGAVILDPFLTLASTLIMVSLAMSLTERSAGWWRYGPFLGVAIGLLAKGPIIVVLAGAAVLPWMLWVYLSGQAGRLGGLRSLPWLSGFLLCAVVAIPWYLLAEMKTPGFLRYFIVGEHFERFVVDGWPGDLYGNGHRAPHGMIWLHALVASLPWLPLLAVVLWQRRSRQSVTRPGTPGAGVQIAYLLTWTLSPLVFFTASANILWTYTLPSLPALAAIIAIYLQPGADAAGSSVRVRPRHTPVYLSVAFAPALMLLAMLAVSLNGNLLKSEKSLVYYAARLLPPEQSLSYVGPVPFSAKFYSRGSARSLSWDDLGVPFTSPAPPCVAVRLSQIDRLERLVGAQSRMLWRNKRYALVDWAADDADATPCEGPFPDRQNDQYRSAATLSPTDSKGVAVSPSSAEGA